MILGVDGICGSGQSGTVKNGGGENAGVDYSAPCGRGGICRSWTNQHDVARVDIAGVDNAAPLWQGSMDNAGVE